jgi:hypothetical protein
MKKTYSFLLIILLPLFLQGCDKAEREYSVVFFDTSLALNRDTHTVTINSFCGVLAIEAKSSKVDDEWELELDEFEFFKFTISSVPNPFFAMNNISTYCDYFYNNYKVDFNPNLGKVKFKAEEITYLKVKNYTMRVNKYTELIVKDRSIFTEKKRVIETFDTRELHEIGKEAQRRIDFKKSFSDSIKFYKPEYSYCDIKGNYSYYGDKIYHMPGQQYYGATIAEVYFCSEAEAIAAGFRKSLR